MTSPGLAPSEPIATHTAAPSASASPNDVRVVRAGIVGAAGSTGVELARLLDLHPHVDIAFGTSRSEAGTSLDKIDPVAPGLVLRHPDEVEVDGLDIAFLCLPHGASAAKVADLRQRGVRVVDLSADLRLVDDAKHERVYGSPRPDGLMAETVYGLTEWHRDAIRGAAIVANPGCYPTSSGMALAPLAAARMLRSTIVVNAVSGVSGAGRTPTATNHFCAVHGDVRPYKVGRLHRHVAEIEQILASAAGDARAAIGPVVFNPHLVPIERGILSTIVVDAGGASVEEAHRILEDRYRDEPFVEVGPVGEGARIRAAAGTNRVVVGVHDVDGTDHLVVTSAIDNLVKGAAGQAIQNMNLMLGLHETAGLGRTA